MHTPKTELKRYRRRPGNPVIAIRLELVANADGKHGDQLFSYHKWGDKQAAKSGDWLVKNGDEVYTVDHDSFELTYTETDSAGQYVKTGSVWARQMDQKGATATKEGMTGYDAGDYLVFNDPEGEDGYAVRAERFSTLYDVQE